MGILRYLFTNRNVQPPPGVFVTGDEGLILRVINGNTVPFVLELRLRMVFPDGQFSTIRHTSGPFPPGTSFETFALQQGFLLGGSIVVLNSVPPSTLPWGSMYAQLAINSQGGTSPFPTQVLISNYVQLTSVIGFPGGTLIAPSESVTEQTTTHVTTFGQGVEMQIQVSPPQQWRLTSLSVSLTTSAAAGNRNVKWLASQDLTQTQYFQMGGNFNHPPSTTIRYTMGDHGQMGQSAPDTVAIPYPNNLWLQGVALLRTVTAGLDIADQYSNLTYQFEPRLSNS